MANVVNNEIAKGPTKASRDHLSDVDQIKVQVTKLMKQLNDLKVSKRTKRLHNSMGGVNPEEENSDDLELDLQDLMNKDGNEDADMNDCNDSALNTTDYFAELLAKESFTDFKEYLIDESLLAAFFPEANLERIQVER